MCRFAAVVALDFIELLFQFALDLFAIAAPSRGLDLSTLKNLNHNELPCLLTENYRLERTVVCS